jgi:mRNA interferase MazF
MSAIRFLFAKTKRVSRITNPKRGEIWYTHLGTGIGSEQQGDRPVLIIQNDVGNEYSPTVIVAALTDITKRHMPTHVHIFKGNGLEKDSVILLEQIRTIDKKRLHCQLTVVNDHIMQKVDRALGISIGLIPIPTPIGKG